MNKDKSIVITGSTRGIGFGLADSFLELGCWVTINGRSQESVHSALEKLSARHGRDRLHGHAGDVACLEEVEALWQSAQSRFGQVDIWINNAGLGHPMLPMWELPPQTARTLVNTNIVGHLNGSRVAIDGMLAQGHGQLYNMEGFGSRGNIRDGLSVYGTTKAAVRYLTEALMSETEGTPVQVGALSPGMVITDLILDQFEQDPESLESAKRIFNILADHVETVTPWLAKKILRNDESGARIVWLTRPKMLWRFVTAPFNQRDLFKQ